jgi:polyhydroxyalkanoate synthesis regulator phasin
MKNYKKVAAVVITSVAITGSASALASASSTKSKSVNSAKMAKDGIGKPDRGFAPSNKEAIITSTLGIDATTLRNRIQAGETLAAIAGAKKDALITALVADETKQIDAAVAAGKLTAEKAATLKSNLTAHVTEEVNAVRGPDMGGKGGPRGSFGPGDMETVITSTLGIDATTLRNRIQAGETLAAIAGAKKDALIAALVTEMTKRIDADLAAGKLTAVQAKSLKDGLTAHVTEEVNEVHGPGMGGKGGRGGHGHGHGPGDGDGDHGNGMGLPNGSTNGIPNTSNSNN